MWNLLPAARTTVNIYSQAMQSKMLLEVIFKSWCVGERTFPPHNERGYACLRTRLNKKVEALTPYSDSGNGGDGDAIRDNQAVIADAWPSVRSARPACQPRARRHKSVASWWGRPARRASHGRLA